MSRILAGLILLLGLQAGWSAESAALAVDENDVVVDYRDGAYFGHLHLRVAVPPALAIEVLTDFDHMAEFVPNLISSRILLRQGNVYRIAQQGRAIFGPFSFAFQSERRVELMADGRLLAQAISGSTKSMRSELRLQAIPAGTRLDYQIEMVPDRWLPTSLGVNFMQHELAEQFSALMREMERRNGKRSPR